MTAGSVLSLKSFTWGGLKPKKRRRSGCGGSTDYEAKKKSTPLLRNKRKDDNGNKNGSGRRRMTGSSTLEVIAPVTSDVEFKYTWPIERFLARVGNGGSGLDSEPFDVNVNGVRTRWNLSIRFWTGEDGERLSNPFVLCLNLLSCRCVDVGDRVVTAGIRFRFGVLNRTNDEYELGAPDREQVKELRFDNDDATASAIRSVGYKNVTLSEKHTNSRGDVQLVCKLSLAKDDSGTHSLSSDLKNLMKDEKSADLVIEAAEGKQFKVHRNILSARSPVLANLISREKPTGGGGGLGKVKIDDLKAEILEDLLDYIYTDTTTSTTNVPDALLAASDLYKLPGLKSHCERNLAEVISPANVATVLLLADRYSCEGLKASALNYCKDNHNYIVKDSNWKTIEEERPGLFEEAVTKVVGDEVCKEHSECVKKRGKRFEMENADGNSVASKLGGR